jgi:hypothetical protein
MEALRKAIDWCREIDSDALSAPARDHCHLEYRKPERTAAVYATASYGVLLEPQNRRADPSQLGFRRRDLAAFYGNNESTIPVAKLSKPALAGTGFA